MNKLDLIFEKEAPEVQKKLMNLLVQYNAMMEYNAKDQRYEIDLLLPFKSSQEKQQFLKSFIERNHRTEPNHKKDEINFINSEEYISEPININTQIIKDVQIQQKNESPKNKGSQINNSDIIKIDEFQSSMKIEQAINVEDGFDQKPQFSVSLSEISNIIRVKLNEAIEKIRNKEQYSTPQQFKSKNFEVNNFSEEEQENLLIESPKKMSPQSFQQKENSDVFNDQSEVKKLSNEQSFQNSSAAGVSRSQQILIEETTEQIDFVDTHKNSSFESHQFQKTPPSSFYDHPNAILENVQQDDEELFKPTEQIAEELKEEEPQQLKKKQIETKVKEMKNKLNNKYKGNKMMTSSGHNLRNKYKDFLKKNHRDIDRLYDNIKKDIKRVEKAQQASEIRKFRSHNDPILVLQEDVLKNCNSDEDRIFKEEIIDQLHQNILVDNLNMSSQDLIRYFRYLHQHAISLYAKQLRKRR